MTEYNCPTQSEVNPLADWDGEVRSYTFTAKNAAPGAAAVVIAADETSIDGRSPWFWLRFPNGDLILACFPSGDTYFETEWDHST